MATAAEFVSKAASQIGTKESPSGSNRQKYGVWYGMNGQPWCDMFVSWCAAQVGAGSIVGKYAYCPSHVNYAKRVGGWLGRTSSPKAGDVVFFSNGKRACHVGIVEKRISSTKVQTIEGNTSTSSNDNGGAVMRRTRNYGTVGSSWYILGFFRPAWSGKSSSTTSTNGGTTNGGTTSSTSSGKATIKAVQSWAGTTADGIYGPKTKAAILRKYQAAIGTAADGIWGKNTRAKVKVLRKGSTGTQVKCLQGALICLGYDTGGFDGEFGSKTLAAVKSYQGKHGLTVDGEAGKNTFAALFG